MKLRPIQRGLRLGVIAGAMAVLPSAGAQVGRVLVRVGAELPGAGGGELVAAVNNPAVNQVGGYAFAVETSDGVNTTSRMWGNAAGGAGAVLRSEGVVAGLTQTALEAFFGLSDAGALAYSATGTGGPAGAFDSAFADDAVLAVEGAACAAVPGQYWRFASRPGITADGRPYFAAGLSDVAGGITRNRGLFFGSAPEVVLLGGQLRPNLPFPLNRTSTLSFDYRFSAAGTHYIAEVEMDTGRNVNNGAIVIDGAGLVLRGELVREGAPTPAAIGGRGGENWQNFGLMAINERGRYALAGDSSADAALDGFILVDGVLAHREGDIIDGVQVAGAVPGLALNEAGDLAFIWSQSTFDGLVETLFLNDRRVLAVGERVDLNGDGAPDTNAVMRDFSGLSALVLGPRRAGTVALYFVGRVDVNRTSDPGDDIECGFVLQVALGLPGDANCDRVVNNFDIDPFVLALVRPEEYALQYPDCPAVNADLNGDGLVNNFDIDAFVALLTGG